MRSTKIIFITGCIIISSCTVSLMQKQEVDSDYSIVDLIKRAGYPVEVHSNVTTEDGYMLDLQRIKHGKRKQFDKTGPVVFLMHGLLTSAENFVIIKDGLPFILADAGYDVWMGNARGNRYSQKHISLNPSVNSSYWDFSWHEIGYYDLPASINYVLNATGQQEIYYIGHSQGTTVFFVMASERPEMNKHIKLMVAIAPVAFLGNVDNAMLRYTARNIRQIELFLRTIGMNSLHPSKKTATRIANLLCDNGVFASLCNIFLYLNNDYSYTEFMKNSQVKPSVLIKLLLEGVSARQLYHSAQSINTGLFRRYNFGEEENMKRYGTKEPPSYNLRNINIPVAIYFSSSDIYTKPKDVDKLVDQLPNVVYKYEVNISNFNHLDFIIRHDIDKMYRDMMKIMETYP